MPPLRLLPLLLVIACGSGDSPAAVDPIPPPSHEPTPAVQGQESGAFDLTLSGDIQDRFGGVAHFFTAVDEETGEVGFILVMNENPEAEDGRTLMIGGHGERPPVGEYPFMDVEAMAERGTEELPRGQFSAQMHSPGAYLLHPLGGTLRITASTPTRLTGSVAFSARGVRFTGTPPSPTGRVQVEGRFEAVRVETGEEQP